MKTSSTLIAVTASAMAAALPGSTGASAASCSPPTTGERWLCLSTSTTSTTTVVDQASPTTGIDYTTPFGPFEPLTIQGGADEGAPSISFNTISDDTAGSNSGTAYIEFTEINLADPGSYRIGYTLSDTANLPKGWTATETTYWSATNSPFATTNLLSPGSGTFSPGAGPYSLTEVYKVALSGAKIGSAGDLSIDLIGAAVPEASVWAMLGLGFAGLGLFGISKRGRRSRSAF